MTDLTQYPKTNKFEIIDTIGTPHSFCITHHHVGHASDNFCGMLSSHAITDYENKTQKPSCGVRRCNLMYDEHERALLVEVADNRELSDIPELHAYLLECKPICEKDGYTGFAFKQK